MIDRLSYLDDGIYEIHDYKTSTTLPDMARIDQDRQLPLYQLAVEEMWRDVREVRLVWHYLAFDKEISTKRSREDLMALKEEVVRIIQRIEREEEFPPLENPICQWCEYRRICPLWSHLYKVEGLERGVEREEGRALVNRYASLKEDHRRLEEEMRAVEQALLEYAKREGVEVIFGDTHKVRVKRGKVWRFPTKNRDPEGRKRLEEWVRRIGRWDEVSSLNATALDRVLKDMKWQDAELEGLRRFATLEERVSYHLSRLSEE